MKGSLRAIDKYLDLGFDASKLTLGFAFYAKYFQTQGQCDHPIGCPTVELEDANGTDTMKSGAVTFLDGSPILAQGHADEIEGGQWYWDSATSNFWTWDTPEFIAQKFEQIVKPRGLAGVSKCCPVTSPIVVAIIERAYAYELVNSTAHFKHITNAQL